MRVYEEEEEDEQGVFLLYDASSMVCVCVHVRARCEPRTADQFVFLTVLAARAAAMASSRASGER